jgi:tetratricopeptide (TPR) repeat protein
VLGGVANDVAIALRGCMEIERYTSDHATYTAGLGIKVGVLRVDYAYVQHPTLEATHHFGLAMDFNFNPALVRIERVEMRDVYTSLYKSYAADTVAQVAVANTSDRPLEVKLGLALPGLTDAPSESTVVLRPRATEEYGLPVVLAPRVVEQRGNRQLQAEVSVKYQSRRLVRTERRRSLVTAYGPGAIDWGLGLDQAAAYVTLDDPVVFDLAREAIRAVPPEAATSFGARGLARVAAVFDALQVLHVVYVPDPNSPYSRVRHEAGTVDLVQYPRQTLARRTGDCDDTSTLVAALLGSVGIDTRLVDAPGHLFLLVDTGVHERNRVALSLDERMTAVVDEAVWIPLETTAIDRGFAEAWRQGAELYSSLAARGEARTVDVAEAQAHYEPAELPGEAPALALDGAALTARFASDAGTLRGWQAEYASDHYPAAGTRPPSSPALLELGHVYFLAGRVDSACASLSLALAALPNSPCAHNDLAVALTARGDLEAALAHFEAAVAADPADPGLWLNLGLVRYAAGDTTDAADPLSEGVTRSGGYAAACALLSVSGRDESARDGVPRLSREQVRRLLQAAGARVPQSAGRAAAAPRRPGAPPPALQGARARTRPAAPRSGIEQLQEFLYWKSSGGGSCER